MFFERQLELLCVQFGTAHNGALFIESKSKNVLVEF
jgi:hypothetical protein